MPDAPPKLAEALSGRYVIERELGAGGMATVYLAEDVKHRRKVAVKVLRAELAATVGPDRFLREIETVAQLTHPHILPLHDSGEANGFLYYVMPYIEGESLRNRLARESELPIPEAVRLLRDVADALASAHRRGVVHRDIKPDNVLLAEHHAYVTDFGVAKAVSEATGRQQLTTAGVALGTPTYMAPEQAAADPNVDHRADIYAFGVLAYEMVGGRPPFQGGTAQAVLAAHVMETPKPVSEVRAAVPPALAELIMRCLAKKPADRPQRADELLAQLESLATPSGGTTPTTAVPVSSTAAPSRRTRTLVVAGVIVVLGAVGAFFGLRRGGSGASLDENAVAVVPFRVSGISGSEDLSTLREGMVDLLYTQLTGDAGLRALDPRTVLPAWHAAAPGDEDLPMNEAVKLAQQLGAGRLLLGTVLGTAGTIRITASLLSVPRGKQVLEATVSGPLDSLPSLVEQLAIQLLSRSAGELEGHVTALAGTPLPAVEQYLLGIRMLRGARFMDGIPHFDSALAIDSDFALAGFALTYAGAMAGNTSTDATARGLRVVWPLRNRLPDRDRTLLEAILGRNYPRPTPARVHLEDLERAAGAPDAPPALLGLLSGALGDWGQYLDIPDWQTRAAELGERALVAMARESPSDSLSTLGTRIDLAIRAEDTSRLRNLLTRYLAADTGSDRRVVTWWRAAYALRDSALIAESRTRLPDLPFTTILPIFYAVAYDGLPLADFESAAEGFARRAATSRERIQAADLRHRVAFLRGRVRDAMALARQNADANWFASAYQAEGVTTALVEPGWEPAVRAAFEDIPAPFDSTASPTNVCTGELWRVEHGDTSRTRRVIAVLDARRFDAGWAAVCPRALDALLEAMDPTRRTHPALERLDSLMQTGPGEVFGWANAIVARLREAQGDYAAALAAARRQPNVFGVQSVIDLPGRLRIEGRLAALAGDTAGAIRAYERYLSFRTDPDSGELADEVAQVREELRKVVGEKKQ
jgi:eukaryotic-like serine/threonine-protein kinase